MSPDLEEDLQKTLEGLFGLPIVNAIAAPLASLINLGANVEIPGSKQAEAQRWVTEIVLKFVKGAVERVAGPEAAANIDTSGDIFAFAGSLTDAIVDERLLTSGALSFAQLLQYENRLAGIQLGLIMASFAFSIIVEFATLGQVDGFVGLVINLVDRVVGDSSRLVSTQLTRRAVADPFSEGYARIHRHKDLTPAEAEEAYALELIPEERYVDVLAADSFKDDAIQTKVALGRIRNLNQAGVFPLRNKAIPPSVLAQAYAAKIVDDGEFVGELARQGYDDTAISVYHALAQLKKPPPPLPEG